MSPVDRFLSGAIYLQAIAALVWLVAVVLLERQRRQDGKRLTELEQLVLGHGQILGSVWRCIEQLQRQVQLVRPTSLAAASDHEKTDPGFQFPANSDRPSGAQQSVMPAAPWQCTGCWRIYELTQVQQGNTFCGHCGRKLEALEESESNVSS